MLNFIVAKLKLVYTTFQLLQLAIWKRGSSKLGTRVTIISSRSTDLAKLKSETSYELFELFVTEYNYFSKQIKTFTVSSMFTCTYMTSQVMFSVSTTLDTFMITSAGQEDKEESSLQVDVTKLSM